MARFSLVKTKSKNIFIEAPQVKLNMQKIDEVSSQSQQTKEYNEIDCKIDCNCWIGAFLDTCANYYSDKHSKDTISSMRSFDRDGESCFQFFKKECPKKDVETYVNQCSELLTKYSSLQEVFSEIVEKHMKSFSKKERQGKGKVYTPQEIVDWIHNKIIEQEPLCPVDGDWTPGKRGLDRTHCDFACGTGHFTLDWYDRLMKHWEENQGHYQDLAQTKSEAHKWIVENCLYFADIDPFAIRICRIGLFLKDYSVVKLKFNGFCGDSLTNVLFENKNFDYIVGNPPYQNAKAAKGRKTATKPLWHYFVEKSFEITKQNGFVALVTPSSWLQPTSNIHEVIAQKKVSSVKIFTKSPFPEVNTTASLWIAKNIKATTTQITITLDEGEKDLIIDLGAFIPAKPNNFEYKLNILNKTINNKLTKFNVCTSQEHHTGSKAQYLSDVQDGTHPYPVFHTNRQTKWSSIKGRLNGIPKVIISKTGTLNGAKVDTEASISQIAIALVTKDEQQAQVALRVLQSCLYRFLIDMVRVNATIPTDLWKSLPAVDLSRDWRDEELYLYFKLTKEEIKVVEDALKA